MFLRRIDETYPLVSNQIPILSHPLSTLHLTLEKGFDLWLCTPCTSFNVTNYSFCLWFSVRWHTLLNALSVVWECQPLFWHVVNHLSSSPAISKKETKYFSIPVPLNFKTWHIFTTFPLKIACENAFYGITFQIIWWKANNFLLLESLGGPLFILILVSWPVKIISLSLSRLRGGENRSPWKNSQPPASRTWLVSCDLS